MKTIVNNSETIVTKYRILIAHHRGDVVSGAELAIADVVDELDEKFQCIMLTPGEGPLADYYRRRGMKQWIKTIHSPRRKYPGLHTIQSIFFSHELKKKNIDAVIANTFSAANRIGTACNLAHIPYAIYVREYVSHKPVHKKILERADRVFAVSEDVRNHLSELIDEDKVDVAYDPILPGPILSRTRAHVAGQVRLLPFDPCHPVVGLVGRITPFKQQDLFVKAIPHVLAMFPEARFVLVGAAQAKEKHYEESIKKFAQALGVADKVAFMGQRSDAIEITSELTVACLTSTREPLGRVILEAQLLAIPVVSSDTGGQAEVIEDGVTGLLFSTSGAAPEIALAKQILQLLLDGELRNTIAANSFAKITNDYAQGKQVQVIESYFQLLCSRYKHDIELEENVTSRNRLPAG